MQLVLFTIHHRFLVSPTERDVTLAITSDDFEGDEHGTITVTIEAEKIKDMTLREIEALAIERATFLLREQTANV